MYLTPTTNTKNLAINITRFIPLLWLRGGILLLLLIAGLLSACQPPSPTESFTTTENTNTASTPIIISDDSVTMAPEYVLSIKPTRYQPSLGLQGHIEAIKGAQLTAAQDLHIQKLLVTEGQWVEKGTPLFIVQRQTSDTTTSEQNTDDPINDHETDGIESEDNDNNVNKSKSITADISDTSTKNDHAPFLAKTSAAINANISTTPEETTPNPVKSIPPFTTVRASFSGRVSSLYIENGLQVQAGEPLLQINDDRDLQFIATLPIQAESQLSIGQNVNFTTTSLTDKFTGQVSKLIIDHQNNKLLVYVHVVKNEASRGKLQPEMAVSGRVDYGQIEVGTTVPKHSIHDVDLTELQKPPYKPLSPLTANVWIIKQDQRLTRQAVEVIEYDPSTDQYLIAGVRNDSLICLADLPLESAGKKVVIS